MVTGNEVSSKIEEILIFKWTGDYRDRGVMQNKKKWPEKLRRSLRHKEKKEKEKKEKKEQKEKKEEKEKKEKKK